MAGRAVLLCISLVSMILPLAPLTPLAGESAGITVSVRIPEVLKLEAGAEPVVFDLDRPNAGEIYPPPQFPCYYTPAGQINGFPIRVFCNYPRRWFLAVTTGAPLRSPAGELPADRLEWSLDREVWTPFSSSPMQILEGGIGRGWQEWPLYFRLRLEGDEMGAKSVYQTVVVYTLAGL